MSTNSTPAAFLAAILEYTQVGSHVHCVSDALVGLTDEDLAYCPVPELIWDWDDEWRWPSLQTPRRILMHATFAAEHYRRGLSGESGAEDSGVWIPANLGPMADSAEGLTRALEATLGRLREQVASLSDGDLTSIAEKAWDGARMKAFVVIDGAILHPPWHLGQIAMLLDWRQAQAGGHALAMPSGPPGEFTYPGDRDWGDLTLDSPRDASLRLSRAAASESPTQSIRRVVEGMNQHELAWRPFPEIENPWFCRAMWTLVLHCWSPKIVYIDHSFGARELEYGGEAHISQCGWAETDPTKQLGALDRAQQWLVDHLSRASDDDLYRVNPMHINHPMTGWQVIACMAQHDAWHGGQLSVMRDLYSALWEMTRSA